MRARAWLLLLMVLGMMVPEVAKGASPSVHPKEKSVLVVLSERPQIRVKVLFDHRTRGWHEEVEWDPAQQGGLARTVHLRKDDQCLTGWQVSVWAETIPITSGNQIHYIAAEPAPTDPVSVAVRAAKEAVLAKEQLSPNEIRAALAASSSELKTLDDKTNTAAGDAKKAEDERSKANAASKPEDRSKAAADSLAKAESARQAAQDALSTAKALYATLSKDGKCPVWRTSVPPLALVDKAPGDKVSFGTLQTISIDVAEPSERGTGRGVNARDAFPLEPRAVAAPSVRAFDPVSGIANELVTVLAEIAVDRAKAGAMSAIAEQLRDAVCLDLVWQPKLREALSLPQGYGSTSDGKATPIFPKTCEALQHLRLQELAATVKTIYPALVSDLVTIGQAALQRSVPTSVFASLPIAEAMQTRAFWADVSALHRAVQSFATEIQPLLHALNAETDEAKQAKLRAQIVAKVASAVQEIALFVTKHVDLSPFCKGSASDTCKKLTEATGTLHDILAAKLDLSQADSRKKLFAAVLDLAKALKTAQGSATHPGLDGLLQALEKVDSDITLLQARVQKLIDTIQPLLGTANEIAKDGWSVKILLQGDTYAKLLGALSTIFEQQLSNNPKVAFALQLAQVVVPEVVSLAVEIGANNASPDRIAQKVIAHLAETPWAGDMHGVNFCKDKTSPQCGVACGAEAAFSMLRICAGQSKDCAPADVASMVAHPEEYIESDEACSDWITKLHETVPDLDKILLAGLEVLQPRSDATPRSIAISAARLGFLLLDDPMSRLDPSLSRDYRHVRDTVMAILQDDVPRALVAGAALLTDIVDEALDKTDKDALKKHKGALRKLTNVLGAITAYAATYTVDPKGDEAKIKEQHEARKKAIEGLIDASTDRQGRGGQGVWSIGANVGFSLSGVQMTHPTGTDVLWAYQPPQLQAPMGIAYQILPYIDRHEKEGCTWNLGFHAQLSLLDLAQFIAYDEKGVVSTPTWGNAFMVGAELGMMFGTPTNPLILGVDIRYSPTLFAESTDPTAKGTAAGSFRASVFASYYVPLFDFN